MLHRNGTSPRLSVIHAMTRQKPATRREECQRGTVQETSYALTRVEPADEHTPQHLRMAGPFGRERPLWISHGGTNFGRILHTSRSRVSLLEATLGQRKDQAGERSVRIKELWR